eukprot:4447690-Prymnesium_polylepis.1
MKEIKDCKHREGGWRVDVTFANDAIHTGLYGVHGKGYIRGYDFNEIPHNNFTSEKVLYTLCPKEGEAYYKEASIPCKDDRKVFPLITRETKGPKRLLGWFQVDGKIKKRVRGLSMNVQLVLIRANKPSTTVARTPNPKTSIVQYFEKLSSSSIP